MAGEQEQQDVATCGSKSSFAQRYVVILEKVRMEALGAQQREEQRSPNDPLLTKEERHTREDTDRLMCLL